MQVLEKPTTNEVNVLFSADRVSRIGDRSLGRLKVDQNTAALLGQNRIGLFAEGFLRLETMIGRLMPLAESSTSARNLVVYSSKLAGGSLYDMLADEGFCSSRRLVPETWEIGKLTFTSIESLARRTSNEPADSIGAVFLLDPTCMVYSGRTMRLGNGRIHDRPQIVANFIGDCESAGEPPLFTIMTSKRAAAIPTESVARAFCLETLWFLDGPTMR